MRKKQIFLYLFCLSLVCGAVSCESLLGNCKTCQLNTYEGDVLVTQGAPTEYCDEDLALILAKQDIIDGTYTIRWDCD